MNHLSLSPRNPVPLKSFVPLLEGELLPQVDPENWDYPMHIEKHAVAKYPDKFLNVNTEKSAV